MFSRVSRIALSCVLSGSEFQRESLGTASTAINICASWALGLLFLRAHVSRSTGKADHRETDPRVVLPTGRDLWSASSGDGPLGIKEDFVSG